MPQTTHADLFLEFVMRKGVCACAVTAVASHPAATYFLITTILPSSSSQFLPLFGHWNIWNTSQAHSDIAGENFNPTVEAAHVGGHRLALKQPTGSKGSTGR